MKNSKLNRWAALLASVLAGQGAVQGLGMISGLLLLRYLSVESYAQYSIAFGFQSTLMTLVDLGLCSSVIALIGNRTSNKDTVSSYFEAAKYFRNWLLVILIPVGVILFPIVTTKYGWDQLTQILLIGSIISALLIQGWISYYSSLLLIYKQINEFYAPQIFSAVFRLIAYLILFSTSILSAWAFAWVNSAILLIIGYSYKRDTKKWLASKPVASGKERAEMLAYILPLSPLIIFNAFQGQISLFIISWFGQSQGVAEIAALSRISQIFILLCSLNATLIAPYIAQVSQQNLLKRFLQILGLAFLISVLLSAFSFFFPDPFLWILGNKYNHLRIELGWTVVVACVGYIGSVMWTMINVRKWIYWWGSFLHIFLLLITQIVGISMMDLSTTLPVIYLSLAVNLVALFVQVIVSAYGFSCQAAEAI